MDNLVTLTTKQFNKLKPVGVGGNYLRGDYVLIDKTEESYRLAILEASQLLKVKEKIKIPNLVFRKC